MALVVLVASTKNAGYCAEDGYRQPQISGLVFHDFPIPFQDLAYIEFFAGVGNVFKCVRQHGYPAASVDIEYMESPPANNPMDINSAAGFSNPCCI